MRPEGWELILSDHIEAAEKRPFCWGQRDCVLWCCDWVKKITGNDMAAEWRGKYSTEQEASEILTQEECSNYSDLASKYLPTIHVGKAQRGDIMLHPFGMLGICNGTYAYFLGVDSVIRLSFLLCKKAWKVG